VFRRRNAEPEGTVTELNGAGAGQPVDADEKSAAFTPAKGRPTPKRSESERRRRQPYSAPGDKKAATAQARNRDRADRARKYEAMKRGPAEPGPGPDQGSHPRLRGFAAADQ
jgi:hypothetical protein